MPLSRPFARRALIGIVLAVTVVGMSACRPQQTRGGFDPKAQAAPPPVPQSGPPPAPVAQLPAEQVPEMVHPAPTGSGAFVGRSGTGLMLNGQPWEFSGFDVYNAASRGNCGATIGAGDVFGSMLDRSGAGVVRVWFFQSLATTGGQRDWAAFDYVLSAARARGVHVIATLTDQWGACETTGYKTAEWFRNGYRASVDPGNTQTYLGWVAEVARHYAGDPTVMAWELVNEPEIKDSTSGPCAVGAAATLRSFVADAAGRVKAADPNHLVSAGTIGGGQCGSAGDDYSSLQASPLIDLCSYHDYLHATQPMPGDQWNGLARRLAQCRALGKPLFVGELGMRVSELGAGATTTTRSAAIMAKVNAGRPAGVVGTLLWMLVDDVHYNPADFDIGLSDPVLAPFAAHSGRTAPG